MEKIELKFQHQKLVFKVEDKEYFISSDDILSLLDKQRTKEIFDSLDPAAIFAEWDNFDFIAKIEALQEMGYSLDEIAAREETTRERLENWMSERAETIKLIKDKNPSNFAAAVRGCKERLPNKRR